MNEEKNTRTVICCNCDEEIVVLQHDEKSGKIPCSRCGFSNRFVSETKAGGQRAIPGVVRLLLVAVITSVLALVIVRHFLPEERLKILFIGNSFTFGHDVPVLFQKIAGTGRPRSSTNITVVAVPRLALNEHWLSTETRALVCNEPWDYVILQDQSTIAFDNPTQMESSISKYVESMVPGKRKQVVLFGTWADLGSSHLEPVITSLYRRCAQKTRSALAPVGSAFIRAQRIFPAPDLFDPDGHHASEYGAWLAAMVIYSTIFGEKPVLPLTETSEKEKRLELLAGVAWEATQGSGIPCPKSFPK
ncbi:MAG: hypothetical protein HQM09_16300 [Candidatus Riflebacteria bacterium]|nr:hypothetical protein [Candidatus Riflebacteria bacterium]